MFRKYILFTVNYMKSNFPCGNFSTKASLNNMKLNLDLMCCECGVLTLCHVRISAEFY